MSPTAMMSAITARGLFSHGSGSSNHTCPIPIIKQPKIQPIFGKTTFHTFAMYISGATGIVTLSVAAYLIFRHATHYSIPKQQRQIIRIAFLTPWVAFICFLATWLESSAGYFLPAIDLGSAMAIACFLLLLCNYVMAGPNGFDDLFGEGALAGGRLGTSSPSWLKRTWYLVLQFVPVSAILWIATAISMAVGTYCATSNKPYFAHIWITIIKGLSTGAAVMTIIKFTRKMKAQLGPHKAMMKLLAFKGVIFVNIFQTLLITILVSSKVIKPTDHLTYRDITVGIPALALSLEMPPFTLLMLYAYSSKPYESTKLRLGFRGGFMGGKAILEALNMTDILSAFVRGPMRLVREQEQMVIREDSMNLMAPPAYGTTHNGGNGFNNDPRYDARNNFNSETHYNDNNRHNGEMGV